MSIALTVSYLFVAVSQIAVAWVISGELWFLKQRPWIGALLHFVLGLVILAVAQVVAGMLTTVVILIGLVADHDIESDRSSIVAILILLGIGLLAARLIRLAIRQSRVLQWQSKTAE